MTDPEKSVFERCRSKICNGFKFIVFCAVFGAVLVVFLLKGVLLIARYATTASCSQNHSNHSTEAETEVRDIYVLTVIVYSILSILRILEYYLLGIQFYSFLFKQNTVKLNDFFKKPTKDFWYLLSLSLPYLLFGCSIPAIGVYQELESAACFVYVAYSVVNFLRYFLAYLVRIAMIYTVLSLRKTWPTVNLTGNNNGQNIIGLDPPDDDLKDWRIVSKDYKERAEEYEKAGKKAETIQKLFQTWFIVPWVIYIVASYLKVKDILSPWDDGGGTQASQIYYMFYQINQIITLVIPYICAKKINTYHHEYFRSMRNAQLEQFKDAPNRLALARQLRFERQIEYDFEPRIVGTTIIISVGSPLYVTILLADIFLSISKSILTFS